jgi:hypothetical protein
MKEFNKIMKGARRSVDNQETSTQFGEVEPLNDICLTSWNNSGLWFNRNTGDKQYIPVKVYNSHQDFMSEYYKTQPKYRQSLDIPNNRSFIEQGLDVNVGSEEFWSEMDRAHMTECAVQRGNRMHRLELRVTDEKPYWLRETTLIKELECSYREAHELSECFEKLNLNDKTIKSLIYGYTTQRTDDYKSVKLQGRHVEQFKKLVESMTDLFETEDLKHGMPDREPEYDFIKDANEELEFYAGQDIEEVYLDSIIERQSEPSLEDSYQDDDDDWTDEFDESLEDLKVDGNVFTTKMLGMPEDSLNERTIAYIKRASKAQLTKLKQTALTGKWTGKYGTDPRWRRDEHGNKYMFNITNYLTDSAVGEFWERVRDREEILKQRRLKIAELVWDRGLSDQVYDTIEWYIETRSHSYRKAQYALTKQIYGGSFTFEDNRTVNLTPPKEDEKELLWAIWRGEFQI